MVQPLHFARDQGQWQIGTIHHTVLHCQIKHLLHCHPKVVRGFLPFNVRYLPYEVGSRGRVERNSLGNPPGMHQRIF